MSNKRVAGVSKKLIESVKLSNLRSYQIAHLAGLHYSTMSRIMSGIDTVKNGDPRVIAIGKVLGLARDECFTEETEVPNEQN